MTGFLKWLSKPSGFSGEEREWRSWKFVFMAYLGAVDPEMVKEAALAINSKMQVTFANMSQDEQRRSATLFSLLVELWRRRALLQLQMAGQSNGYETMHEVQQKAAKMLPAGAWRAYVISWVASLLMRRRTRSR